MKGSVVFFSFSCCSSSLPYDDDIDLARDLRISYIVLEDFKDAGERRAALKYQYFFECFCPRCTAEDEEEEEEEEEQDLQPNKITNL